MKRIIVRLLILLIATTALSSCIWYEDEGRYHHREHGDWDHDGEHHEEHHDEHRGEGGGY